MAGTGFSDLPGAWNTYTPTLTSGTGTITTPGSTSGRWTQIGKLVVVKLFGIITTNGTAGTSVIFSLPAAIRPVASFIPHVGAGRDTNGNQLQLVASTSAGVGSVMVVLYNNAYPGGDATNFYGVVAYEVE